MLRSFEKKLQRLAPARSSPSTWCLGKEHDVSCRMISYELTYLLPFNIKKAEFARTCVPFSSKFMMELGLTGQTIFGKGQTLQLFLESTALTNPKQHKCNDPKSSTKAFSSFKQLRGNCTTEHRIKRHDQIIKASTWQPRNKTLRTCYPHLLSCLTNPTEKSHSKSTSKPWICYY